MSHNLEKLLIELEQYQDLGEDNKKLAILIAVIRRQNEVLENISTFSYSLDPNPKWIGSYAVETIAHVERLAEVIC